MSEVRSSAPRGIRCPVSAMIAKRTIAASARRMVAAQIGGTVSLPMLIARKVLPQISTHATKAPYVASGDAVGGGAVRCGVARDGDGMRRAVLCGAAVASAGSIARLYTGRRRILRGSGLTRVQAVASLADPRE